MTKDRNLRERCRPPISGYCEFPGPLACQVDDLDRDAVIAEALRSLCISGLTEIHIGRTELLQVDLRQERRIRCSIEACTGDSLSRSSGASDPVGRQTRARNAVSRSPGACDAIG